MDRYIYLGLWKKQDFEIPLLSFQVLRGWRCVELSLVVACFPYLYSCLSGFGFFCAKQHATWTASNVSNWKL